MGGSVPPSGSLRQDYDSQASPRALHHNDDDDDEDDEDDDDDDSDGDSYKDGVRSPSVSSASDSSHSATKRGMCFWVYGVCVYVKGLKVLEKRQNQYSVLRLQAPMYQLLLYIYFTISPPL